LKEREKASKYASTSKKAARGGDVMDVLWRRRIDGASIPQK
jgi:hypothetical protein